jgi:predicted chitinase
LFRPSFYGSLFGNQFLSFSHVAINYLLFSLFRTPRSRFVFTLQDNYNTFVEYTNSAGTNSWCPRYSGGCTYRGRGAMQLTHDYNYRKAGTYFNQPFVSNPALVATQPWAFETAGFYWGKDWRNIGPVAETGDIERVTRMINGGTNGLTHRRELYTKARQCIPRY